jgi:hypothetical protein
MDVLVDMVDPSHRNEVVFPVGSIALCQLDLVLAIEMVDIGVASLGRLMAIWCGTSVRLRRGENVSSGQRDAGQTRSVAVRAKRTFVSSFAIEKRGNGTIEHNASLGWAGAQYSSHR